MSIESRLQQAGAPEAFVHKREDSTSVKEFNITLHELYTHL